MVCAGLGMASFVPAAFAGFEWRPPQDIAPSPDYGDTSVVVDTTQTSVLSGPVKVERNPLPTPTAQQTNDGFIVRTPSSYASDTQATMPTASNNAPMSLTGDDFQSPQAQASMPEVSETIVIDGSTNTTTAQSPTPLMATSNQGPQMAVQELSDEASSLPESGQVVPASSSVSSVNKVVEGFGRQVPLVVALRQIAPPEYEFDFNTTVDMGVLVDWQGGSAWQSVMQQTLDTRNLSYTMDGNIVTIHSEGMAPQVKPVVGSTQAQEYSMPIEEQLAENMVVRSSVADGLRQANGQSVSQTPQTDVIDVAEARAVPPMSEAESSAVNVAPATPVQVREPVRELPKIAFQRPQSQETRSWYGAKDSSLRNVLQDWASKANVELYWDSEFDYPLKATVVVHGDFEEAVRQILEGFDQAQPRPLGRLHKNSDQGPAVLVVEANDLIN